MNSTVFFFIEETKIKVNQGKSFSVSQLVLYNNCFFLFVFLCFFVWFVFVFCFFFYPLQTIGY